MEQITAIYQWVLANSGTIVTTATAVVAAASTIAALTPTPKDDGLVKKAYICLLTGLHLMLEKLKILVKHRPQKKQHLKKSQLRSNTH